MKLPNFQFARIFPEKITLYLLNSLHPRGGPKAAFLTRFGFDPAQPDVLEQALLSHCASHEVEGTESDKFGTKYRIRGPLNSPDGRNPDVLTVWVILTGESDPRFVTLVPQR